MKMKVLDVNEKFMRLYGLFPSDQSVVGDKMRRLVKNCVILALNLCTMLGSAFYVYFYSDDISECLIALLQFSCALTAFVTYSEIIANAPIVERIFDELQRTVNNGKFLKH